MAVANTFQELKSNRALDFQRIVFAMHGEDRKHSNARIDSFVQSALRKTKHTRTANRLKDCKRGSYCGNIYCSVCRSRMAEKLLKRFQVHIFNEDLGSVDCSRRLRWGTILHDVVEANLDAVKSATQRAREDYINFNRKFASSWAQGAFEYELLDMQKVERFIGESASQSRKKSTLLEMTGYQNNLDQQKRDWIWKDSAGNKRTDYVLVHTHFLMDGYEYDWDDIKKDAVRRWGKHHRVKFDALHDYKTRSLEDSLFKMASYCFKNRCDFHYDFGNYRWEDDLDNEKMFSVTEINTLFYIYDKMMGSNRRGMLLGWNKK